MLVALILTAGQSCFPMPPEIERLGSEAVMAYSDALAESRRNEPRALHMLMSFKGEAPSAEKVKVALEGTCTLSKERLSCGAKGSRLVIEHRDGCWKWVGFN
jgi:hypothetical protein